MINKLFGYPKKIYYISALFTSKQKFYEKVHYNLHDFVLHSSFLLHGAGKNSETCTAFPKAEPLAEKPDFGIGHPKMPGKTGSTNRQSAHNQHSRKTNGYQLL